jgi:hypothetical protein
VSSSKIGIDLFVSTSTSIEFRQILTFSNIDAHGLKIQERGYLMFFAKIPRGSRLSGNFGFDCVFINKCFEICLRVTTVESA